MRDVEIPSWLKGLPLAPEFHPTDTEFADPVAYISKIEKEASTFGICKVIPPLPKPSKKYVISNLNKSLSKSPELGLDGKLKKLDGGDKGNDGEVRAVFTTRQQELGLGQSGKRTKGAVQPQPLAGHKQVWQSGEVYTLEQFESKSKAFARSQLGMVKEVSPLVIEALFWKAAFEKPIYVEYANDVPGSGFGEPEGTFRYFRRRVRRRGTFDRNNTGGSDKKKQEVDSLKHSDEEKGASAKQNPSSSVDTSKAATCSTTLSVDQTSRFPRQKGPNVNTEIEGTAGWKLSNSPWNLQVIARSPGSLTRFMPDDIPGVTSPMVYIGMLFSWFAWHVEDHELHSLNFLHTGSPKTWYAVPAAYAFSFEEVIRSQAYGGNIDRLDALTRLGEKTTLLSPEVLVSSGLPCCRLVQNPGEFVVTFPRSYHVGFSHGFSCGEAANFGTPKWLTVAKEAAVRRAAMNYLPMLSHQQLLYLLTMSFVSRVPRSLLPGARSSRLRDRLKEERELSVKKAFLEDILNENNLLTILLRRSSSYRAVLWDLESLPSSIKDSGFCSSLAAVATSPQENVFSDSNNDQDPFRQMSLYMQKVNDLYVEDDDLSHDFELDSGTLPCVACGVLGFPLMAVVQPSEKASADILHAEQPMVHGVKVSNSVDSRLPSDLNVSFEVSVSDELGSFDESCKGKLSSVCQGHDLTKDCKQSPVGAISISSDAAKAKPTEKFLPDHKNGAYLSVESTMLHLVEDRPSGTDPFPHLEDLTVSSQVKFSKGWVTSRGSERPRIFCLEHAIQIEKLLHSKGGANVLVLCHSDFQKIKAYAAAIAEETGSPFRCIDIPFDTAALKDLNLINLAIDDEEKDECGDDWTSKLNINLRHCVKVRKDFPSKKLEHALTLDGLFSDTIPSSSIFSPNWQSRKSRTKRNLDNLDRAKPSGSITAEKNETSGAKSNSCTARKEDKILQYYRRNFRSKSSATGGATKLCGDARKLLSEDVSAASCTEPCRNGKIASDINQSKAEDVGEYSVPALLADLLLVGTPCIEKTEAQGLSNTCKNFVNDSEKQQEVKVAEESNEKSGRCYSEIYAGPPNVAVQRTGVVMNSQMTEHDSISSDICDLVIGDDALGESTVPLNGDVAVKGVSKSSAHDPVGGSSDEEMEETVVEKNCMSNEVLDFSNLDNEVQREILTTSGSNEDRAGDPTPIHISGAAKELCSCSENLPLTYKRKLVITKPKVQPSSIASKRKRGVELQTEDRFDFDGFIRSPCERLRPRAGNDATREKIDRKKAISAETAMKKMRYSSRKDKKENTKGSHRCDLERCQLSFQTKAQLLLHKRNQCPHEGCGKRFSSHKYAVLHVRVHDGDRPLKCSWKGCTMSFKWAWARTEHLRLHTGERPYECKVKGCGLTF
ncbi:hypothetical protein RJ639_037205, partial [Escallonia herrerae]